MTGYNTATLTVTATESKNGYQYRCVVTGKDGKKVESAAATLTVAEITEQPKNVCGLVNNSVKFSVKLSATSDIKYEWQYRKSATANWTATTMTGYNTKTLTVDVTAARSGYEYRCKITDSSGNSILSESGTLSTVSITTQPTDKTTVLNANATFSVGVSRTDAVSYQWQYRRNETANWTNTTLTGYNTAMLTVQAIDSRDGYQYRCIITDGAGNKDYTDTATLRVLMFTKHPVSVGTAAGKIAEFTVETNLNTGFTYQWQFRKNETIKWSNTSMNGCKTYKLQAEAINDRNGYQYRCLVIDADGKHAWTNIQTV